MFGLVKHHVASLHLMLEVSILCPFRDPVGSCGMKTRIDGRPCEDRNDNQLRGAKECEIAVRNSRAYQIL